MFIQGASAPLSFFILPIRGLRKILVWWTMIGGDRYGHGG
jgi:hypothetical protein